MCCFPIHITVYCNMLRCNIIGLLRGTFSFLFSPLCNVISIAILTVQLVPGEENAWEFALSTHNISSFSFLLSMQQASSSGSLNSFLSKIRCRPGARQVQVLVRRRDACSPDWNAALFVTRRGARYACAMRCTLADQCRGVRSLSSVVLPPTGTAL